MKRFSILMLSVLVCSIVFVAPASATDWEALASAKVVDVITAKATLDFHIVVTCQAYSDAQDASGLHDDAAEEFGSQELSDCEDTVYSNYTHSATENFGMAIDIDLYCAGVHESNADYAFGAGDDFFDDDEFQSAFNAYASATLWYDLATERQIKAATKFASAELNWTNAAAYLPFCGDETPCAECEGSVCGDYGDGPPEGEG